MTCTVLLQFAIPILQYIHKHNLWSVLLCLPFIRSSFTISSLRPVFDLKFQWEKNEVFFLRNARFVALNNVLNAYPPVVSTKSTHRMISYEPGEMISSFINGNEVKILVMFRVLLWFDKDKNAKAFTTICSTWHSPAFNSYSGLITFSTFFNASL